MLISLLYRSGLPARVVRSCPRKSAPWTRHLVGLTSLVVLSVSARGEFVPTAMSEAVDAEPAKQVTFDAQMLNRGEGSTPIDITRFERADIVLPGKYRVDLLVNGQWRGTEDIEFKTVVGEDSAQFCYDRALLIRAGIDLVHSAKGQGLARKSLRSRRGRCVLLWTGMCPVPR